MRWGGACLRYLVTLPLLVVLGLSGCGIRASGGLGVPYRAEMGYGHHFSTNPPPTLDFAVPKDRPILTRIGREMAEAPRLGAVDRKRSLWGIGPTLDMSFRSGQGVSISLLAIKEGRQIRPAVPNRVVLIGASPSPVLLKSEFLYDLLRWPTLHRGTPLATHHRRPS